MFISPQRYQNIAGLPQRSAAISGEAVLFYIWLGQDKLRRRLRNRCIGQD
jgi:hypothetical protein